MKKLLLILFLFFSVKSFSQSAGKGGSEKNSGARKPHAQMQHFEKRKKDRMLKRNGTSYLRRKRMKSRYNVDKSKF